MKQPYDGALFGRSGGSGVDERLNRLRRRECRHARPGAARLQWPQLILIPDKAGKDRWRETLGEC
jgi:hypothetical protein